MEKNRIHPVAVSNGVRMSYARQQEVPGSGSCENVSVGIKIKT